MLRFQGYFILDTDLKVNVYIGKLWGNRAPNQRQFWEFLWLGVLGKIALVGVQNVICISSVSPAPLSMRVQPPELVPKDRCCSCKRLGFRRRWLTKNSVNVMSTTCKNPPEARHLNGDAVHFWVLQLNMAKVNVSLWVKWAQLGVKSQLYAW